MVIGICKLCNKQTELIKAHIIPECFYRLDLYSGEIPRLVSNTAGTYPKRAPIGVYDENILCGPCDQEIGIYDQHACELLIRNVGQFSKRLSDDGRPMFLSVPHFDYNKLKLFLMSILWRAGISDQKFFDRVSLGPFLDKLHSMIVNKDPLAIVKHLPVF